MNSMDILDFLTFQLQMVFRYYNYSRNSYSHLPAFKGNEWTVSNLIDQGYKVSYSVQASSKKEALQLAQNKNIELNIINAKKIP